MRDLGNEEMRLKSYKGVSHIMQDPAKKFRILPSKQQEYQMISR